MGSYGFVIAVKIEKNGWPLVLQFGSFLALFGSFLD